MKYNIIVSYLGRHGAGPEYAYEMTKGLLANNCNVYAIISQEVDNLHLWKNLPLARLFLVPTSDHYKGIVSKSLNFIFRVLPHIKKCLQNQQIHCVYSPMWHPWNYFVHLAFRHVNYTITLHDPQAHPNEPFLQRQIQKYTTLGSDSIVLLSNSFVEYTAKKYNKSIDNIIVIPHGAFSHYEMNNNIKEEKVEPIAEYNFLFFGRITKYKGLELLLEAYKRLTQDFHNISLRIIGSGDLSIYPSDLFESPRIFIENKFIKDEDVHAYFLMPNTITVLPYTSATQSGVIPIAMNEKSLIIATNNDGLLEQTLSGKLALISEISVDSLYDTMRLSVENYQQYMPIVDEANKYIKSLSWDQLAKILLDYIRKINK